ncbi:hypothetical protein Pelo_10235 [Pelomyxa schiedti]|nr:hypothetical protein Pelo_10235 [Pelomyxa schiedti]
MAFALGCYLIASQKPNVRFSAPRRCSLDKFLGSGFAMAPKVRYLCFPDVCLHYIRVFTFFGALSCFLSFLSLIYWFFAVCSIPASLFGAYLYYFWCKYPFLLDQEIVLFHRLQIPQYMRLPTILLVFSIFGCVSVNAAFLGMVVFSGNLSDWHVLVYYVPAVTEALFLICNCYTCFQLVTELEYLQNQTFMIPLPKINLSTPLPRTTKLFFQVGWLAVCAGVVINEFVFFSQYSAHFNSLDADFQNPQDASDRLAKAALVIGYVGVTALSIAAVVLFSVTTHRRYATHLSVAGIVIAALCMFSFIYVFGPLKYFPRAIWRPSYPSSSTSLSSSISSSLSSSFSHSSSYSVSSYYSSYSSSSLSGEQ